MTDHVPFFIVGCGRSGTSLLRRMLVERTNAAIPLESLFIIDYLKASESLELPDLVPLLMREPEIREWGLEFKSEDLDDCRSMSEVIAKLHWMYAAIMGKEQWGQKTPRFIRNLALLLHHFPTARFLHIVRDPRAVVSSLVRSDVHKSNVYYAALRWRSDVALGLDFQRKYPDLNLQLSYESLVGDPDIELTRTANFLNLKLDPHGKDREDLHGEYSAFYNNIHSELNKPIHDQSLDRWRDDLNPDHVAMVESICCPLMEELGYHPAHQKREIDQATIVYFRLERLIGLFQQMIKYLRYRPAYLFYLFYRKFKLHLIREFLREINR